MYAIVTKYAVASYRMAGWSSVAYYQIILLLQLIGKKQMDVFWVQLLMKISNFNVQGLGCVYSIDDISSCLGDTVTYNCTLQAIAHIWRIHTQPLVVYSVVRTLPEGGIVSGFRFQLVVDTGDAIISSMTVTTFLGLNNVTIQCADGNIPEGEGITQQTTLRFVGE